MQKNPKRQQSEKTTRQQGNKATRQQGNKATRQQGDQSAHGEQGLGEVEMLTDAMPCWATGLSPMADEFGHLQVATPCWIMQ
jgi:hypothetical protein